MLPRPGHLRRRIIQGFCAGALTLTLAAAAQTPQDTPDPNLYTLHVYNNLVQFPTIVLGPDLTPLPPIPREKFGISLDGGPAFRPTHMRREGDDPISLAILLDDSGNQRYTVENSADAFAQLAPAYLHPKDHISIYAADCKLIRSVHDQPAASKLLSEGIRAVLAAPGLHGDKARPACGRSIRLWDYVTTVAGDLAGAPSRRVILILSLGSSGKTIVPISDAALFASGHSVAVFGLRDPDEWTYSDRSTSTSMRAQGLNVSLANPSPDDPFSVFCATTGGMVFYHRHRELAHGLQDFIALLRNRYIIEFPRPDEITASHHNIVITVPRSDAFVASTGASTPLADPAILADPTTLRSPSSPAVIGNRHPTEPKH